MGKSQFSVKTFAVTVKAGTSMDIAACLIAADISDSGLAIPATFIE